MGTGVGRRESGRAIHRLSARFVSTVTAPGYHPDGGGLYLQVTRTGAKSWIFRYKRAKRSREMGLGSTSIIGLQDARVKAADARRVVLEGRDPITERDAARAPSQEMTWGEAKRAYIAQMKPSWKNEAQAEQWEQSLDAYGPDDAHAVRGIDTPIVLRCLQPIWTTKTETATRVRGRIERILDWSKVHGMREGENPARWRGHLEKLLPKPSKVAKAGHHPAMPYADIPAFMAELVSRDALSRTALRFTILTAARTNEVTGARWAEFDLDAAVWTIPAGRMKAGKEHRVPLVAEVVEMLRALPRAVPPFPLSESPMLQLLQRHMKRRPYTVHGFRSSFRDWAAEETHHSSEVVEMALAHAIENDTEAAYRRGELLKKRRALMEDWAAFVDSKLAGRM